MPTHQDDPPLEGGKGDICTPVPISHCLRVGGGGIKSPDPSSLSWSQAGQLLRLQ